MLESPRLDIKEKKMTLPLIHALNQASKKDRRHVMNLVRRHHDKPEKVREVIEFVRASEGIRYAEEAMYRYRTEAFEILHQFSDSAARQSLEDLVIFVTDRKK